LHLTLILPDGSRSFIPAAWTNLNEICPQKFKSSNSPQATDLIASTSSLSRVRNIVDALLEKLYPPTREFNNSLKEEHTRAKTTNALAEPEEPKKDQAIWKTLNHQKQKEVATFLSHLISKSLCMQNTNQTKEKNHE